MNLRQKFFWNAVISFSVIILLWNIWGLYSLNTNVKEAYSKYKNEKVGSDKELQDMVISLENSLNNRKMLKFKIKESPLDLIKVKSLMEKPVIFDLRNIFEQNEITALGIEYFGIGK